jgi:Tfp pilus assembly protein PilN
MAKSDMSFLPEDYLEARSARRTNLILLALFALVLTGIGVYTLYQVRLDAQVRTREARATARSLQVAQQIELVEQMYQRKDQMIRKARVTSMLLERTPRSVILAELINNMPATLSLLDLELDTKAARPTTAGPKTAIERAKLNAKLHAEQAPEVLPAEVSLKLVGVAPTDVQVAQFMTALGRNPLFAEVNLSYSEALTVQEQPMRKFAIDLKVRNDVDVNSLEPTLVKRELKQNPMDSRIQINAQGQLVAPSEPLAPVRDAVGRSQRD